MSATTQTVISRPCIVPVARVIDRLRESPNVCDQRKARDIEKLGQLAAGAWSGQVAILGADCGRQWSLDLLVQLAVPGLVWRGQPEPNRNWMLIVAVPHNYPLALPEVRFVGAVPYSPHVIHREFLPDEGRLPPELRQFVEAVRAGREGVCCYMRHSQWSPLATHDLARVLWQVGRVVTGARHFGERGSLNNHARDHFQHLRDQRRLPLGMGLSPPWNATAGGRPGPEAAPAIGGEEDEDVEWIEGS